MQYTIKKGEAVYMTHQVRMLSCIFELDERESGNVIMCINEGKSKK